MVNHESYIPQVSSEDYTPQPRDSISQSASLSDGFSQYMSQAGRHDLLTAEEEASLGKQLKAAQAVERGDSTIQLDSGQELSRIEANKLDTIKKLGRSAYDSLYVHNIRLVVHLAHTHKTESEDLSDVVQAGNIGLGRAVEKFEPAKGFRFTTYAAWWIRQAIQRGHPDNSMLEPVRFPAHFRQDAAKILSVLEKVDDGTLTKTEVTSRIAQQTGFSKEKIEETALRRWRFTHSHSLDEPIQSKFDASRNAPLADIVPDETTPAPEDVAMATSDKEDLHNRLRILSERDRTVISLRYGLLDGAPRTLQDIGNQLGLTREAIRQIEARSLDKMRQTYQVDRQQAS